MNPCKNLDHGDILSRKNAHMDGAPTSVCARKRSIDCNRGDGLLKKLKQAYDSSLKARSLNTPDVDSFLDSKACAQPLPTVSDEEIPLSHLAILGPSRKFPVKLQASDILDLAGDDHSTVVEETWHLEDLSGPDEATSDTAADLALDNLFGISNDLFHFALEADYPPLRNEKGEIVHFASVREAIKSIGNNEEHETSNTQSRSETTNASISSVQPTWQLLLEESRTGPENVGLASSGHVLANQTSRSELAMSGVTSSSLRPILPREQPPRPFNGRDESSCYVMLPPPPIPFIAIQQRRQFHELPHPVPSHDRVDGQQSSITVPPFQRPLHHPLSVPPSMPYPAGGSHDASTRNELLSMPLVQNCEEPAVLTLTSFPFRIICVNKAFSDLTGRSHELIGYSFYELFVHESDYTPSMASTPTLLGLFNNDIVRVITKQAPSRNPKRTTTTRRLSTANQALSNNLEAWMGSDDDSDSSIGSIGVEDDLEEELSSTSDRFCTIRVNGIPCDGTNMQYFSIHLSPLQLPTNVGSTRNSLSTSSVIYLPMPCGGTGSGLPSLRPRLCAK